MLEEELNGDLGELFRRILRERREIVSGPAAEYVIDLTLPDAEYHADAMARRDGYGSASAYIAEKCPVVIAAVAPDAPIKLGGTAETLQRRREAAMTSRTGWPLQPDRHTIVLELESHVIRTE